MRGMVPGMAVASMLKSVGTPPGEVRGERQQATKTITTTTRMATLNFEGFSNRCFLGWIGLRIFKVGQNMICPVFM